MRYDFSFRVHGYGGVVGCDCVSFVHGLYHGGLEFLGRGGGEEFWVADCDEAVVAAGGTASPLCGRAGGGGFEVWEDGGKGRVVVPFGAERMD